MASNPTGVVKLTAAQRMQDALRFLQSHSEAMRSHAPRGKEDEYAAAFWWAREPSYCWSTAYGDFTPATLNAGIGRGWVERDGSRPCFRITPAGLAALSQQEAPHDR